MHDLQRRYLLKALALTGTVSALRPFASWATAGALPELPGQKVAGDFLVHSELPWALETRRSPLRFRSTYLNIQSICTQ